MNDNILKRTFARWLFRSGKPRAVVWGPMRGLLFRPTPMTGLSPFYSGPERCVQRAFAAHLGAERVALDVGANWGMYSLLMGRLVGPRGRVLAFEPFPACLPELEDNLRLNRLQEVVSCLPVALGGENGERWFRPGPFPTMGQVLPTTEAAPGGGAFRVAVRRLDAVPEIAELARLDLIKIDVEGAEEEVLVGGVQTIRRFRPVLVVELHNREQDVAVARWLCAQNYEIRRLTPGPPIEHLDRGRPELTGVWGTIIAHPSRAASGPA